MNESSHHVSTEVLIGGLEAACARFVASKAGTASSFQAAFEMLAWVGAIRDRFNEECRPIPSVLNGLCHVRNFSVHEGVDPLEWFVYDEHTPLDGPVFPGEWLYPGESYTEWKWRPRKELGSRPRSRKKTASDPACDYDKHVAGRGVRDVFSDLMRALGSDVAE